MTLHRRLPPAQISGQPRPIAVLPTDSPPPAVRPTQGSWIALGIGIPLVLLAGWWLGHLDLLGLLARLWVQLIPDADKSAWYLSRAAGTVAYLLLAGSTIWGLLLSSRIVADRVPPPLALAMHGALSWLAIGFATFHAFVLLGDGSYTYRILDLLVPFVGPYRPLWVGLGTLGLYGAVVTSASFGLRLRIGQRWWRRLHTLTFAIYVLVTLHGLLAGTDSSDPGARALYLGSVLVVLLLLNYRLLTARQERAQRLTATHPRSGQ